MAHLKSLLLLFVIVCVNETFRTTPAESKNQFEIKYFAKASWYNAHLSCLECGGQLASIESEKENSYVVSLITDLGLQSSSFWIAGTDLANEGIFNWFTTGAPLRYTNFRRGKITTVKMVWNIVLCCTDQTNYYGMTLFVPISTFSYVKRNRNVRV